MNDGASAGIVALICADLNFFILDYCLLYMDASHKPAIYLRLTAVM